MHNRTTVNGIWKVLKRGRVLGSYLTTIEGGCCEKDMRYDFLQINKRYFHYWGITFPTG